MDKKDEETFVLKRVGGRSYNYPVRHDVHTIVFDYEGIEKDAIKKALSLIVATAGKDLAPSAKLELAAYLIGYLELEPMVVVNEVDLDITKSVLNRAKVYEKLLTKGETDAE